jgi:hypothetical protein
MKKHHLIIILTLFFNNLFGQKIVVVDSVNKKPIAFVSVRFNKENGTYTDENGTFELNKTAKDTLIFSHISFDELVLKATNIKDTIIMSPNAIIIKEITVTNGKESIKYIDFPKKKSSYGSFPVFAKSEIISLVVPNSENSNATIKKINFNFSKNKSTPQNESIRTAFKVNIYNAKNKKVKEKIFSSETYTINTTKKDKIEIDLTNESIEFSENGIFIGIEAIGDIGKNGNLINNQSSIRPLLSDNNIVDYSSATYIRYTFDRKQNLKPLNDFPEKMSNSKMNRNLSFGLTISK